MDLRSLSMNSIVSAINSAPLTIKEEIIGVSLDEIKRSLKEELKEELKADLRKEIEITRVLVPSMIQLLKDSKHIHFPTNVYETYSKYDREIVKYAMDIAFDIYCKMEDDLYNH
jgi:hypothetical protein